MVAGTRSGDVRVRRFRGFTLIELLVVMAIVALLASVAAPRYFNSIQIAKEATLRSSLAAMRDAIDQFRADKDRYPDSLDELVDSRYLRGVPEDPLTGTHDAWVIVGPPADGMEKGGIADIRSRAAGRASDGRLYSEW